MTAAIRWLVITPGTGYGNAGEAYLSGLRAAGVPVTWTPLGYPSWRWNAQFGPCDGPQVADSLHADIAYLPVDHDTVVVHATPLWHEELEREADGRRLVAFTTWETDHLPDEWVGILNRYDGVVVPSRFNQAVFEAALESPVRVVPHIAHPPPSAIRPVRDARYTFYLIATWTARKAIPDAVSAYLEAFRADDDVVLVLHTTKVDLVARGPHERPGASESAVAEETWYALARLLAGRRSAPEIRLSTRALARSEVDALHAAGDCFVLLSHGEGFGLPAFEAAAAGNPVIVPGWGGSLDFLPADYPYRVEYDLVPTLEAKPDAWWAPRPGERWAQARIAHAAALMREVYEQRDKARRWGERLASEVRAGFGESRVTRELLAALYPESAR